MSSLLDELVADAVIVVVVVFLPLSASSFPPPPPPPPFPFPFPFPPAVERFEMGERSRVGEGRRSLLGGDDPADMDVYCAVLKPWFVVSKVLLLFLLLLFVWPAVVDSGAAVEPPVEKLKGVGLLLLLLLLLPRVVVVVGVIVADLASTSVGEKELGSRDQG